MARYRQVENNAAGGHDKEGPSQERAAQGAVVYNSSATPIRRAAEAEMKSTSS